MTVISNAAKARRVIGELFTCHFVNHSLQAVYVSYNERSLYALEQALLSQAVEFAGHGFTMSAYAACDFRVGRGRVNAPSLALIMIG